MMKRIFEVLVLSLLLASAGHFQIRIDRSTAVSRCETDLGTRPGQRALKIQGEL